MMMMVNNVGPPGPNVSAAIERGECAEGPRQKLAEDEHEFARLIFDLDQKQAADELQQQAAVVAGPTQSDVPVPLLTIITGRGEQAEGQIAQDDENEFACLFPDFVGNQADAADKELVVGPPKNSPAPDVRPRIRLARTIAELNPTKEVINNFISANLEAIQRLFKHQNMHRRPPGAFQKYVPKGAGHVFTHGTVKQELDIPQGIYIKHYRHTKEMRFATSLHGTLLQTGNIKLSRTDLFFDDPRDSAVVLHAIHKLLIAYMGAMITDVELSIEGFFPDEIPSSIGESEREGAVDYPAF